jgi:DNA-binding transcriptional ArsR family regulator
MFRDLDPVLHSQVRLAVISVLMGVKSAEFSFLLECTKTTKGNLSFQLNKLNEAEYIEITKSFRGNYPLTTCKITDKGSDAFEAYVVSISDYLKAPKGAKVNTETKNKK